MKITKTQIALLVALLVSNAIILFINPAWAWLRMPVVVAFVFALPGWAWLPALGWLHTNRAVERLALLFGASSLLVALALYFVVLLPGPFTEPQVLITLNLLTLAGLAAQFFRGDAAAGPLEWPSRRTLLILLAIVAVAAVTRFTRLNYAEFMEDELENVRMIVQAYKGEEYAPFTDSKGPIHWLLPAALWYANGWLDEGLARTTFALASLLAVPLMFALTHRLTGKENLGLAAAGFMALNGFYVSLARHVENRALIVFWGVLAVWLAYRYYKERINSMALYAAFTLAVGLIAHPTVILFTPAVGFVVLARDWPPRNWRQYWLWPVGAVALFVGVSSLFYVPYLLNPQIGLTYQYFAEDRVGTSLLYNRMDILLGESELYSSRFYAPVLLALLSWLVARLLYRHWGRNGLILFAGLLLAAASTIYTPQLWVVGSETVAFVPHALLVLSILVLPRVSIEQKTALLWFGVPFGVLLFLAKDASNHIQIAFTGLTMLAVYGLADFWDFFKPAATDRPFSVNRVIRAALVAVLVLFAPLVLFYEFISFNALVATYEQIKLDFTYNPNSWYTLVYRSIPRPRKVISNPRLGGWKPVGYLWATGALTGDFRSMNESFAVPVWYTFQTPRSCYDDPQNYWVHRSWEGWPADESNLLAGGYTLTRIVQVDGQPSLHLYQKNAPARQPEVLNMEDYRSQFDLLATPARFAQADAFSRPASLNFGDKLLLRGFDLPATARAGELLPVTLYWQSLALMDVRYRTFVHLEGDQNSLWGQHDDDPGCRLITTDMLPGMTSSRQFRVPVAPTTPPGEYKVVVGLYRPDTQERLPIWNNTAQNSPGDSITLGTVRIIDGP